MVAMTWLAISARSYREGRRRLVDVRLQLHTRGFAGGELRGDDTRVAREPAT